MVKKNKNLKTNISEKNIKKVSNFPKFVTNSRLILKKKFRKLFLSYKKGGRVFFQNSQERLWYLSSLTLRKRKASKKLFFPNTRKMAFCVF